MSFFNFDDKVDGTFESGGGNLEPIPDNTDVLAAPDEAKWDEREGDRYISLRWSIIAPKEYKGRKIFQKIRVLDSDPKKSEKARRMLAAIDVNAGGKLMKANEEPTDKSLTIALVNKPMVLKLMVWETEKEDGSKINGNWVAAVSPRKGSTPVEQVAQPEPEPAPAPVEDEFEDDVPFN
jgi:hypothetical protein